MLLEGIDKDRDINIKDLTIEPVKKETGSEFDPETDVPDRARMWLKEETKSPIASFLSHSPEIATELILCARILFPEDLAELNFSEENIVTARERAKQSSLVRSEQSYWPAFANLKAGYGQKANPLIRNDQFSFMIRSAAYYQFNTDSLTAARLLSYALLITPEKSNQIPTELRKSVKDSLIKYLVTEAELAIEGGSNPSRFFLRAVLQFKLLYPKEDAGQLIDRNILQTHKTSLKDLNRGVVRITFLAAGLALLAADNVQVLETGLELIKNDPAPNFKTEVSLPVRRAF